MMLGGHLTVIPMVLAMHGIFLGATLTLQLALSPLQCLHERTDLVMLKTTSLYVQPLRVFAVRAASLLPTAACRFEGRPRPTYKEQATKLYQPV
jgi:hypothetical protein